MHEYGCEDGDELGLQEIPSSTMDGNADLCVCAV